MTRRRADAPAGFTLVELLVAVLVFGLLAATAYGGLDALTAAAAAQRERADRLAEVQRAVAALDTDLRQLASRLGRDGRGRTLPALVGDERALTGRRGGRLNPAGLPRSQLQQVRWRAVDGALVREIWARSDAPPETVPLAATRFESAGGLRFRYRDARGGWHRQWPAAASPHALPSAIEYRLNVPPFGRIRRLIAL